jgi:steroid delta-isomerase-like uncharacterized protein
MTAAMETRPNDTVHRLLREQIEGIWGAGRTELIARNYAADAIDHMPVAGQQATHEGLADVVAAFRRAFPDLSIDLHGTIASGDMGVDFWTLTGTHLGPLGDHPPTGRRVRFSGIDIVRVADGRIADLWHVEEMAQCHAQLGLPPPAQAHKPPVALFPDDHVPGDRATVPHPATLTGRERRNLDIARRHIEGIWAGNDERLAHALYADDVVDHQPAPGQRAGVAGILDVLRWLRESMPDLKMAIQSYVVEGDLAADRWVMRGTHSGAPFLGIEPSGRRFEIDGMDVIRIRDDGRISDVWHVEDFASLRAQIAG